MTTPDTKAEFKDTIMMLEARVRELEVVMEGLIEFRVDDNISIVRRTNAENGNVLFAVKGGGVVLNKNMEWEYEPMPSSRTEEFIERTRFDFNTAFSMAKKYLEKEPNP